MKLITRDTSTCAGNADSAKLHPCSFVKYTQFCITKNVRATVQFVMYHNKLLGTRICFDFIATLNILKYLLLNSSLFRSLFKR